MHISNTFHAKNHSQFVVHFTSHDGHLVSKNVASFKEQRLYCIFIKISVVLHLKNPEKQL